MKIFISWSGNRSKQFAEFLRNWIGQIIQNTEPWISVDIEKGKNWNHEISSSLEESKVGIICLTRENLNSPWILFEAGAISKSKDSFVCTFLLDLAPADLSGPLSIFQATRANKEDIFKLLTTINQRVQSSTGKSLSGENLKSLFDIFYPKLEQTINEILNEKSKEKEKEIRTDRELLEESVEILRTLKRSANIVKTEASKLLEFYAKKYAKMAGIQSYESGSKGHIDKFLLHIGDNPLLLEEYGGFEGLKNHIVAEYDLPF